MRSAVPIPARLAALPRGSRGYPIPASAHVDAEGRAHFQVLDHRKVLKLLHERRCGLCGQAHHRGVWFVGGPSEAVGALPYADPPMHWECAEYALKVCPWLALPSYRRRIDDATLSQADKARNVIAAMPDARPPLLIVGMAFAYTFRLGPQGPVIRPETPWRRLRYFKDGVELTEPEAGAILRSSAGPEDRTSTG